MRRHARTGGVCEVGGLLRRLGGDSGPDELRIVAPLAKAYCSDAFFFCASENIQIHGGIGFTWDHDAHLYFKRAKTWY